jgi:hypothetical protein
LLHKNQIFVRPRPKLSFFVGEAIRRQQGVWRDGFAVADAGKVPSALPCDVPFSGLRLVGAALAPPF